MRSTGAMPNSSSPVESNGPEIEHSQHSHARTNDVAVIGMACRVAGGITDPDQLWLSLLERKNGSREIPAARWAPYYGRHPHNLKVLNQTTSRGYFVENMDHFDGQFFGISQKEAEQMDPQQRMALEVAWEALEDAGIPAQYLSGSNAAVLWGVNSNDYANLLLGDLPNIDAWMGIGTAYCGIPNRISYHLNLKGPSIALDAACASSLVAIHHGVKTIVSGESTTAIVGGVNAICSPGLTRVLDKAGVIANDGRCCSFDDNARGYGRGEGAGAVILKDLTQAIREGDQIHAVIKGSAVAHNGKTEGIMAPSSAAQQLVAKKALRTAGVDAHTIRYVEAHATSTALGDPTELAALAEVYGTGRAVDDRCYIGSIKPNIGHLEAGAGIMGLIKTVLVVQKGMIPPQANLQNLNSRISWHDSGIRVVQERTQWPDSMGLRRAAVCSYGYGGTVSHAIVEEAPRIGSVVTRPFSDNGASRPAILLLSAPQEQRLVTVAESIRAWICHQKSRYDLASICKAMALHRSHHNFRVSAVADDIDDAVEVLGSLSKQRSHPWISHNRVLESDMGRNVVWVFSGHGAQWPEMGKELVYDSVFYGAVKPLDKIVIEEIGLSPIKWLQQGDFHSSDRVQILTYMMQIGVSAILQNRGTFPQAIIGHSVGEIAATVVSGALSPKEGILIVVRRAVLYRRVMGRGAMALVGRSYAEAREDVKEKRNLVAAIDSSPTSCVISGTKEAIAAAVQQYQEQGVQTTIVSTDVAFHSNMLNPLKDPLYAAIGDVTKPASPMVKLYSTTLSDPRSQTLRDARYWVTNMIDPVRLTAAVRAAVNDYHRIFLEISSHPIVSHSIRETVRHCGVDNHAVISTLRKQQPAEKCILHTLGQLHCCGVQINWGAQMPGFWVRDIPTAPWNHRSTWRQVDSCESEGHDVDTHSLLGPKVPVAGTELVLYNTTLDNNSKPFPGGHPVLGTEIVPAACLVNTFLKATGSWSLQNINFRVPVPTSPSRRVQVLVQGDNHMRLASQLAQCEQDLPNPWVTHLTAQCIPHATNDEKHLDIHVMRNRQVEQLKDSFTVDYLAHHGVSAMGFPWKVLEHHRNRSEMAARVDVYPGTERPSWEPTSWAPLMDAATSITSTIFSSNPELRMPAKVQRIDILTEQRPPKVAWVYIQRDPDFEYSCHVQLMSETGQLLLRFTSMHFSGVDGTPGLSGSVESLVHRMAWKPVRPAENPIAIDQIILVANGIAVTDKYAKALPTHVRLIQVSSANEIAGKFGQLPSDKKTVVLFIPDQIHSLQEVPEAADNSIWQLLSIIKCVVRLSISTKVFVLTNSTAEGKTPSALAHAPLVGLSRIVSREHPDVFGGLVDNEEECIPFTTMRYIQRADVIRVRDGVARTVRLRSLRGHPTQRRPRSLPRPEGTYLITGGIGALGLAVAEFLAEHGARRLVLVSRRSLPPRRNWHVGHDDIQPVISTIEELERQGVWVHVLSMDIGRKGAEHHLLDCLDRLNLPPILGVVHAAGVFESQLVFESTRDSFSRVLSPKVTGALALHEAFPPKTLDFFVLFSSCGQLFGLPGQASYGSANSFLDTLATHRRSLGDNAVAFQWTSWRGMGMGSKNSVVAAEIKSRGITDVTRHDAFQAWLHLARYDVDHGVVLRTRPIQYGEPIPVPILKDIAVRHSPRSTDTEKAEGTASPTAGTRPMLALPKSELKTYIDTQTRTCVAKVLHLSLEDVDSRVQLSDIGLDSMMNVDLRQQLQSMFNIDIPPTFTWNYPTISHLVAFFTEHLAAGD